jgi:pectate lyase
MLTSTFFNLALLCGTTIASQTKGVHCLSACTLDHVYFEKVCEDAVTIKQKSGTSRINYGGAKGASDKVIQHNGGGTVSVTVSEMFAVI